MLADRMCNSVNGVILTFVVVAFFNIQTGHGYSCYFCAAVIQTDEASPKCPNVKGLLNNACWDPFIATTKKIEIIDCADAGCVKKDVYDKDGNFAAIARSCNKPEACGEKSDELVKQLGGTTTCHVCHGKDLCNSASASFKITLPVIVAPWVTFLFKK